MARGRSVAPKRGWFLHWQRDLYRIVSIDGAGLEIVLADVLPEDEATEKERLTNFDLFPRDADPGSAPLYGPTREDVLTALARREPELYPVHPDGLPDSLLAEARRWISSVRDIEADLDRQRSHCEKQNTKFRRTPALEAACTHQGISISTFYRRKAWCNTYRWDAAKLARALQRADKDERRIDLSVRHFIERCILRLDLRQRGLYETMRIKLADNRGYWVDCTKSDTVSEKLVDELLSSKISIDAVTANPDNKGLLKQISLPSFSWFCDYYKWFTSLPDSGRDHIVSMYGRDVWEREFMAFDHFAAQASRPLQYVFGDHTLLNIIAVDKEGREHTFRLWWTVNFCAYIRGAVGMALLHEPPSIKSATAVLHSTIWPKQNYGDLELERLLPCFGIPEMYSLDNAWAHHSYTLEELAQKIGQDGEYTVISIEFRRPYRARQGALIERFFGDIKKRLAEALRKAGAIATKHPKHIRAAREEACLLYQDIYRILLEIMVDHFHTQHSELGGLSPHEQWMRAIEESGYKEVPPHTPAMERLFWRYVPRACAITEKGVGAFNMHYSSDQLRRIGKSKKQASGNVYQYSYDPDNISRIALFRNGDYLFDVFAKELRLPDGSLRAVSEAEMKLARDIARTRGAPLRSWYRFLDSKLADLIRQRQQERKEVEKAAQAATEGTQQDEQEQNGADAPPPSDADLADEIKRNLMGFTK